MIPTANFKTWQRRSLPAALFLIATVTCARKVPETNDVPPVKAPAPSKPLPQGSISVAAAVSDPLPFRAQEDVSVRLQREIETAAKEDPAGAARMAAVHPVLTCVEKSSDGEWRAHFGYRNKGPKAMTIATGLHNRVWPPPIANGQPTAFAPGAEADAVDLPFKDGGSVAWVLGQSFEVATKASRSCGARGSRGRRSSKTPK